MFLKYIWKSETSVWKKNGKKEVVKPSEVFETNDRVGKQYLRSYKTLFEETVGTPQGAKKKEAKVTSKKTDK